MTPRKLIPYLAIFLVLAGVYLGLNWQQERREAREMEAQKVFAVKEADIGELVLRRGKDETRVMKKDNEWRLTKPLDTKADNDIMAGVLTTLARLRQERDLGGVEDLKPFGLEASSLVVEFMVQGKPHRLAIGAKAPGDRSYYARKDQEKRAFIIGMGDKDSLDRPVIALRDKTLLSFSPEQLKAVKIKTPGTAVHLEKTGLQTWRWVGREKLRLRSDRVEALLRQLQMARVKEFIAESPKDSPSFGLAKPQVEVALVKEQGQDTLALGAKTAVGTYALLQPGRVVLTDADLVGQIARTMSSLEDRRVWSGSLTEARKVVWGAPDKLWTAVKEKNDWKITGPGGQEMRQPTVRVETGLWKFTQMEYRRLVPAITSGAKKESFRLEIYDEAGKPLMSLEEWGRAGDQVEVRTRAGDQSLVALMPNKEYQEWQGEMAKLAAPGK